MTLTHVRVSFSTAVFRCTPPPHQQGWSRGTQDGMSVKAWERREREKLGLFPQAWLMAPRSQQRPLHRGMAPQWVEQTHEQTHMNRKYIWRRMCADAIRHTRANNMQHIYVLMFKSLKAKNKLIFSHLFAYYTNNNTKVLSSSAFFLFIKCLLFLVHHNHTHIQMCLDACLIRVLRPREHRSVLCTWTWTLRIPVMNLNFKNTEGGSTHIYKRQPRMTQCLSLWQSRKKTNIKGWWCTRGWT